MDGEMIASGIEREYEFQLERMAEIILFFVSYPEMHALGKTKLMKLLYYADFDHMERTEQPITGAVYRKLPQGPVPDEADFVLDLLEATGQLHVDRILLGRYDKFAYKALVEPKLTSLNDDQRETVRQVAHNWKYYGLNEIVDATHNEAPWLSVEELEPIPYDLAFYRNTFGELSLDPDEVAAMSAELS